MACSASTALGGARKKNGFPRMRAVVVPRPDMQHSRFTTSTSHAAQASRRPGDQTSVAGVDKDRVLVVAPRAQYAVVIQQVFVHKLEGIEHRPERRDGSDLEFAEP